MVQSGDTLSTIAFAYGVNVNQIRQLNSLPANSNKIIIGQRLIIRPGVQPTITPSETSTIAPTETFTPTVPPPTLTPINNLAIICVKSFDDVNQNHWNDSGESSLDSLKIRLAASSGKDISTEAPACFKDLSDGTYTVSAVPPKNYGLTTPAQLQVQVIAGQQIVLRFGAAKGYQLSQIDLSTTEAATPSPTPVVKSTKPLDVIGQNSGLIVLGIAGLLFVGGMTVAFLARRT